MRIVIKDRVRTYQLLYGMLMIAGCAFFVGVAISHIGFFSWHDDEAVFVLTAEAVSQGLGLYRDVWFNYPPAFIFYLAAAFRLAGYSLTVARLAVIFLGLVSLLLTWWIASMAAGKWAGLAALWLLATAPHFMVVSGAVLSEVPAAAVATAAVGLALVYARRRHWGWLVGSGIAYSLALSFKPTMWAFGVVPALAVVLTENRWARRIARLALLVFASAVPLVLLVLSTHPEFFVQQFTTTYLMSREAFQLNLADAAHDLFRYFYNDKYGINHVSLVILALLGLVPMRKKWRTGALLGAWPFLETWALLFHTPLYRHHQVVILYPVAVWAGIGLVYVVALVRRARNPLIQIGLCALVVLTVVEFRDSLWTSVARVEEEEAEWIEISKAARDYLLQNTDPGAYIITDAQILAIRAGRRVPPEVLNVSRMRIYTGGLSNQQLIEVAKRYQPEAIILWERKLTSTDDFVTWVGCHYDLAVAYDDRHQIYRPRSALDLTGIQRLDVDLERVRLLGYVGTFPEQLESGSRLDFVLYWQALERPDGDFKVFVHVLDRGGNIIAQRDVIPRNWSCPTWIWGPGEVIEDPHQLTIEKLGEGGPYRIVVGLYERGTGRRMSPDEIFIAEIPGKTP